MIVAKQKLDFFLAEKWQRAVCKLQLFVFQDGNSEHLSHLVREFAVIS